MKFTENAKFSDVSLCLLNRGGGGRDTQLVWDTWIPTVVFQEIHLDHPPRRLAPDGLTASRPKQHGHHPFLPFYLIWGVVYLKGTIKIDIHTQQTLTGLEKTKISEKYGKKKKQ